jgi:hypothetical protein
MPPSLDQSECGFAVAGTARDFLERPGIKLYPGIIELWVNSYPRRGVASPSDYELIVLRKPSSA